MRLPNGDRAVVDRKKLSEYCLNPDHPRGKHKARVFSAVLGITADHAADLRTTLLEAAAQADAQPAGTDRFGVRYVIDCPINGPQASALLRSAWIIRQGEAAPRLTSRYLK